MRRFLRTRTGKAISQLVVFALMLPFISYYAATKADAQIQTQPRWAVIPFENLSSNPSADYGMRAAQAVYDELAKLGRYELVPLDSVNRTIQSLGLQTPVTDEVSLLRLANELNVTTIVTGQVVGTGVQNVNGGKQGEVGVRVVVRDVASGLPVNGAAVPAKSSVRAPNTSDDTVITEAMATAAAEAVAKIQSQVLPTATVLNTRNDEALINRGAREGFKDGQQVIVTRGREEVATASVFGTEPDSANIRVTRSIKGIQPGDKVRVVFAVPDLVVRGGNRTAPVFKTINPPSHASSSSIISLALVLGVVGVLLSGGRSNSNNAVNSVVAQAVNQPGKAGNQISWRLDPFFRNSFNKQFLVFRSDIQGAPVVAVDASTSSNFSSSALDREEGNVFSYAIGLPDITSLTCSGLSVSPVLTQPGPLPGQPYFYEVAGVYEVPQIDLPVGTTNGGATGTTTGGTTATTGGGTTNTAGTGGGTGTGTNSAGGMIGGGSHPRPWRVPPPQVTTGTTATTGTNATTTATTGSTSATTTGQVTTGGLFCFFQSSRSPSSGSATFLSLPQPLSPQLGQPIKSNSFSFTSSQAASTTQLPVNIGYVVQISSSPAFPASATVTSAERVTTDTQQLSIAFPPRFTGDTFQQFLSDHFGNTQTLYWRIGVRNVADVPGPLPDPTTGLRYMFSVAQNFLAPGGGSGGTTTTSGTTGTPPKRKHPIKPVGTKPTLPIKH